MMVFVSTLHVRLLLRGGADSGLFRMFVKLYSSTNNNNNNNNNNNRYLRRHNHHYHHIVPLVVCALEELNLCSLLHNILHYKYYLHHAPLSGNCCEYTRIYTPSTHSLKPPHPPSKWTLKLRFPPFRGCKSKALSSSRAASPHFYFYTPLYP
jgi:hypothetical protein